MQSFLPFDFRNKNVKCVIFANISLLGALLSATKINYIQGMKE
jgi:hypothetical protein